MDSEILWQTHLCGQWADETLITFLNRTFALIARHTDWGGHLSAGWSWRHQTPQLLCVINDRGIPSFAEEDRHDQQRY
jgi:hypothetical protein